jgi:hypothetical protein
MSYSLSVNKHVITTSNGIYYAGNEFIGSYLQSNITSGSFSAVVYADNQYVAVSSDNNDIYSSIDGQNWTIMSSISEVISITHIEYKNGNFIAAGITSDDFAIFYSSDGLNWIRANEDLVFSISGLSIGEINTLVEVQVSIGGQGTPGSYVEITEPQVLYTVPEGTETTVTSVYVTNHDLVERTYDLAVVPEGETLSLKHHIRWDMPVSGSDFDLTTAKLTLSAGDTIYVFPSTINKVGFTAFGVEKS